MGKVLVFAFFICVAHALLLILGCCLFLLLMLSDNFVLLHVNRQCAVSTVHENECLVVEERRDTTQLKISKKKCLIEIQNINCGSASLRHIPLDLTGCDAAKSHITSLVTDACNKSESMAASNQKRSFPTCAQCDLQKWHQCCNLTMIDEQGHCRLVVRPPGTPALPWEYLG